jgi:hypothetical protein
MGYLIPDMYELLNSPARSNARRLAMTVWLDQTNNGETMRCVFTTTISVDIDISDDKLRKAFLDLVTSSAKNVLPLAGMLARGKPTVTVVETTREGKRDIDLFASAQADSED